MGFTTGFTGGVTLTLSIAYLSILAHQRNREYQAAVLRQQTRLISGIMDPLPPVLPPTRAELAAAERANLVETAKDRWNSEVESAVRWVQTKDWEEVREGVETAVARLWARTFKDESKKETAVEEQAADKPKDEAPKRSKNDRVALTARSADADTRAQDSSNIVHKAEGKAGKVATEARGSIFGAIWRGLEKAKSAVGMTNNESELKPDEKPAASMTPVERALNQRYQQSSGKEQSVEDILAARYVPVDQKDNTQLKTL
ncbi:hypothetical protein F5X96DRAFT_121299 [Biscogniauxia mediterranea]|nr:hypothetical protein F5X96DRAFT_121299 [Biscogniauxia mediterranea]